jgi:hypothetical protein
MTQIWQGFTRPQQTVRMPQQAGPAMPAHYDLLRQKYRLTRLRYSA